MANTIQNIRVIGAGIAGLTAAYEFARRGQNVELVDRNDGPGLGCSFHAGGMIAPWVEAESAEPLIVTLGLEALDYWTKTVAIATQNGSIIVAPPRDRADLVRFERMTQERVMLDRDGLREIEPELADHFDRALYFPREAHLDPREAVKVISDRLRAMPNVRMVFGQDAATLSTSADWTIDCRGLAARDVLTDLRGVKGEKFVVHAPDVHISRACRMIHPRHPCYIVPRSNGQYMLGATMIETEEPSRITVRSALELLGAAYTLHPSFAEAAIIEMGSDLRPAFADNLPRLRVIGRTIHINGLYRHGYLVSPSLARMAADVALTGAHYPEVMDEHHDQRHEARG